MCAVCCMFRPRYLVLVATSGDTGSAVLDGFSKLTGKGART